MDEKDLSEFQQEGENDELKKEVRQEQAFPKKVGACGKPDRSGSFVRNWGGWEVVGE